MGYCASVKAQEFLLPVYQSERSLSLPVIGGEPIRRGKLKAT